MALISWVSLFVWGGMTLISLAVMCCCIIGVDGDRNPVWVYFNMTAGVLNFFAGVVGLVLLFFDRWVAHFRLLMKWCWLFLLCLAILTGFLNGPLLSGSACWHHDKILDAPLGNFDTACKVGRAIAVMNTVILAFIVAGAILSMIYAGAWPKCVRMRELFTRGYWTQLITGVLVRRPVMRGRAIHRLPSDEPQLDSPSIRD